jgi:hypothetical protein
LLQDGWPKNRDHPPALEDEQARLLLEHVREATRALKPADAERKSLQDRAIDINIDLLRDRWLLIEQQGPSVQGVVVGILVSWVTVIFASFGLNAPRNGTVVITFLICSLAIGGAIFLILEMDRPLGSIMQISSGPIENALAQMKW